MPENVETECNEIGFPETTFSDNALYLKSVTL